MGKYVLKACVGNHTVSQAAAFKTVRAEFLPNEGHTVQVDSAARKVKAVNHFHDGKSPPIVVVDCLTPMAVANLLDHCGWRATYEG